MIDKVQKIREKIEIVVNRRLNLLNGDYFDLNEETKGFTNEITDIIDSLQEEPVSVWHDIEELPMARECEYILVIYKDTTSPSVAGNKTQVSYWDRVDKWAYLNDLLNLSNVQRTTKDWKEPVSEDLEEASREWLIPQLDKSYANYGEVKMMELTHFDGYAMLDAIEFGAQWQKEQLMAKAIDGKVLANGMGNPILHLWDKGRHLIDKKVKVIVIKED